MNWIDVLGFVVRFVMPTVTVILTGLYVYALDRWAAEVERGAESLDERVVYGRLEGSDGLWSENGAEEWDTHSARLVDVRKLDKKE
jgi:hypothetical protein